MEEFRVNMKNHFRSGSTIFYGLLTCIFFPFVFSLLVDEDVKSLIWISGVVFVVMVLPAIFIHIRYYLLNKDDIINYDFHNRLISIKHKGETATFSLDDIDHIERFMSFNLFAGRAPVMPFDEYNHSVISLKNGKKFIITSLLVPNLNLPLESEKITIKESFYRYA